MKQLITVILVMLALASHAQVPYDLANDFAPIGAKWTHHRYGGYPNCGIQQAIYCTKDIIFRNRNAKVFSSNLGGCQKEWIVASDSDRIYHYAPELDSFYVLYDFSLQAGDTLRVRQDSFPGYYDCVFGVLDSIYEFSVVIDSTDTIEINGSIRRRQFISPIVSTYLPWSYGFFPNISVIEGIGSTHLFFGSPLIVAIGSCMGEFCSYEDSTTTFVLDDCSPSSSLTPDQGALDWHLSYLTREQLIQVQLGQPPTIEVEISLWDIQGKRWLETRLAPGQQQTEFSIPALPAGVYLIRLARKGETIASRKVLLH